VLQPVLAAMRRTTDARQLMTLAQVVQAVPGALTAEQAAAALEPVLVAMRRTTNADTLLTLAVTVQAVPGTLTAEQAAAALEPVLAAMRRTTDADTLQALAAAVQALAGKLTAEQTAAALAAMGGTTDASHPAFAETVQTLAGKLTAEQAGAALKPVLAALRDTTEPCELRPLAGAIQALAGKLTAKRTTTALDVVRERLAAANDMDEAFSWASAIAALARAQVDKEYIATLVEVLKYPTAAGGPTNVLMAAWRERFPDVPALTGSLSDAVPWLETMLGTEVVERPPRDPHPVRFSSEPLSIVAARRGTPAAPMELPGPLKGKPSSSVRPRPSIFS
jgi:hypothetical protein